MVVRRRPRARSGDRPPSPSSPFWVHHEEVGRSGVAFIGNDFRRRDGSQSHHGVWVPDRVARDDAASHPRDHLGQGHRKRLRVERTAAADVWSNEGDLVFTDDLGEPVHPNRLSQSFNRIVRDAGLPRSRLHDLRHRYATLALRQECTPRSSLKASAIQRSQSPSTCTLTSPRASTPTLPNSSLPASTAARANGLGSMYGHCFL